MSYILEALKKAQAERQLGSAPTIHAPQPLPAADVARPGSRTPLLAGVALGAAVLAVAIGALLWWRSGAAPAQPAVAAVTPAVPAVAPAVAPVAAPVAPPPQTAAPAPAVATTLDVTAPPPPVVAPAPVTPRPAPETAAARPAVPAPAVAQSAAPAAAAPIRAPAPEDSLPFLQQLPDGVQSQIPRVAFGGYMYSANPADRLLLVDKALRHEGEEVAPGLVLEKLLPKAAVMNFRGVRYRVGL